MYDKKGLCLSEVQIKRSINQQTTTLRKMINVVLDNCNRKKVKMSVNNNPRNEKSKNALHTLVFIMLKERTIKYHTTILKNG